ncbi:response regulator [Rivularia sp. UHCC 0363]|uniref:response regulator n=1 Tax=Rivularia sp. UHCC 0363 TaxID=3110244 RepID=UPI002B1F24A6|nr:response regulator [Rivularia sp. UHCC 0363]MEA5597673.1 response regulator [Rivularia sp. UHCC 0363]
MQNQRDFGTQIPNILDNYHSMEWNIPEVATGMVFHLADGTIQACNAAAESILGFTLAQMLSSTSLDHLWQTIQEDGSQFPGDAHPAIVALRTGQPVVGVVMGVYQPNGNLIWLKINAYPLFQVHNPTPWAAVAMFTDVTLQKGVQAESAIPSLLSQNEPQTRTVLVMEDCAEDREMYCRYLHEDTHHTYRILEAETGDAGLEICRTTQLDIILLDYRLPDYEGLEFIAALHAQSNGYLPPIIVVTGQGNEAIAVQLLKTGAKDYLIKGQLSAHELRCAVNHAIKNAQLENQLQEFVEKERLFNQIAQRTAHRLEESQERLQLGVKVAGVALAKFDYASNNVELSPEAATLFGLPTSQLVVSRSQIHATFHPEEHDELLEIIEQVLDPRGTGWFARDHRVVWETGEVRWLTVRKQVFFDRMGASGRPIYAILAALDITERKQADLEREHLLKKEQAARAEAEQANRIKDEFLAVLSHELRSPLNPILGWAKLLQQRKLDETRTKDALATIQRNAELQAQLIEDLLDISRIMRGKLTLTAAPVSLRLVISAALETVQLAADTKNIQINLVLPDSPILVNGDAGRLQQVVWNLLSNAVKFTDNGGQVHIHLTQVDNYAQIQIIDTGKGINPEFLPYIFEHFRQEDGATTRKFGGLGLGLAIARQIVELHGGRIGVDSAGIGQGATFTVQFPLLRDNSQIPDEEMTCVVLQSNITPLANIRILVVDDDVDACDFLAFLLRESGANVTVTASALEALQTLEQSRFDVLLSDIGMPEMDGYTFIQTIRGQITQPYYQIPAIALTAYAGEWDCQLAISAGFQHHVAKPIDENRVITLITQLVQRKVEE